MFNRKLIFAACASALFTSQAYGQAAVWQVVAGEDGRVVASNLPSATNRSITDIFLGDAGAGQVGFRVSSPAASAGYWASKNGIFNRYTQTAVTGTLGPGRSGAESNHVFLDVYSEWGAVATDGQRVFAARASDPNATANASYGLWRWDGSRNSEAARTLSDGVYGPGLGAGWVFPNSSTFANARMMVGGNVLITSTTTSPTGASSGLIVRHVPGTGNIPCLRNGATEPALSPGLTAGDSFQSGWSFGNLAITPQGRVYGDFSATGSRDGIWEICNGAPRAIAVDDETGARGPGMGSAYFTDVYPPFPGVNGAVMFFSYFRTSPSSSGFGLFLHNGSSNQPLAYNDTAGLFGPNWAGSTWGTFDVESSGSGSLSTGGQYASFTASVNTPDSTARGLWRVRVGQRPELVALIGLTGQYAPEPGRTWASFGASAILSNGDIVLEARSDPGNTYALWLLENGNPTPRRILEPGQTVPLATTQGTVQATIASFDLNNGGAQYSRGSDGWIGADGTIMVVATLTNYGEAILTSRPSDRIFSYGFN